MTAREIVQHLGTTINGRPTVVWLLDDGRVPPLAVAHWPEAEPPGTAHTYADCLDAITAWATALGEAWAASRPRTVTGYAFEVVST